MTARKYAGNDDTNTLSCNFLIDRIGERRRLRFSLCPSHDEVSLSCKPRLCNMRIAQDSDVVDSIAPSSVVCHHPWGRYNHAAMCCYVFPLSAESWPPFLMWARCFPLLGAPVFLSVLVHHHFSVSLPVHYHQVSLHTGNPPSPLHCPVFTNHPFSLCPREFRPSNNIRTGTHWQTFGVDPPSTEYPFRLPSRAHSE